MSARLKWHVFRFLLICSLHSVSIAASWGFRSKRVVQKAAQKVVYTPDEKDHINLASLAFNYVYKKKIPTDMTYQGKTVENILSTEAYELPPEIFDKGNSGKHAFKHIKKGFKYFGKFFRDRKLSSLRKAMSNKISGALKGIVSPFAKSNFEDHKPPVLAIKWGDICVVSYRESKGADWTKTNVHGAITAAHEDLERFNEDEILKKFRELERPGKSKPFWYAINHGYFYHFLISYERVKRSLKRAGCTPENTVATGHSLGGAVAVVLALSGQANHIVGVGAPKVVIDKSFSETHQERLKEVHLTDIVIEGDLVAKIGGKGIMPYLSESNRNLVRLPYPKGEAKDRAKKALAHFAFYIPMKAHTKVLYTWLLYDTKVLTDEIYLQLCVHLQHNRFRPKHEFCKALKEKMNKD